MTNKITDIEGIGPSYAEKLVAAQITTTEHLLQKCGSAKGRKSVAQATGVSESTLLKWANMADVMRISGVGSQYAELLEAAGVDTIKELRTRNVENLVAKMNEINAEKKLTRGSATVASVTKWIDQAKSMDPMITH